MYVSSRGGVWCLLGPKQCHDTTSADEFTPAKVIPRLPTASQQPCHKQATINFLSSRHRAWQASHANITQRSFATFLILENSCLDSECLIRQTMGLMPARQEVRQAVPNSFTFTVNHCFDSGYISMLLHHRLFPFSHGVRVDILGRLWVGILNLDCGRLKMESRCGYFSE